MDTPKHTPGPWSYFKGNFAHLEHPGIEALDDTFSVVILGYKDRTEDDGGVRGRTAEEAEANARLIAAAPDLLAALKEILAADCKRTQEQAAAAIVKAEGRVE